MNIAELDMADPEGKKLYLSPLPPYENELLSAIAFFNRERRNTQARSELIRWLRTQEEEVFGSLAYYAHHLNMDEYELLRLIHTAPDEARERMKQVYPEDSEQE